MRRAALPHVGDLRGEHIGRIAVHEVRVALARDQILRRGRLAARVERGPRSLHRLRREASRLDRVVPAVERVLVARPHALENGDELLRARIPFVVFDPGAAVHRALGGPPCADDVQREAAVRDAIDRRRLLCDERGKPEVRADRRHELEARRERGERGRRRPRLEAIGLGAFDVVEVQLGDERDVPARVVGADREVALVVERRGHALVLDVAQPSAEDRHPEAETHGLPGPQ